MKHHHLSSSSYYPDKFWHIIAEAFTFNKLCNTSVHVEYKNTSLAIYHIIISCYNYKKDGSTLSSTVIRNCFCRWIP